MHILGIIPARYGSTRFPGKPLVRIGDKSMIRRVYEQCKLAQRPEKIVVATDDERIFRHIREFGGEVVMTREDHQNGTSRCAEALELTEKETGSMFDAVINIQGDEPFINPEQIDKVATILLKQKVEIATLAKKIEAAKELFNPNVVKVITDREGKVLYFSRQSIPFVRDVEKKHWMKDTTFYKHIGIYGYTKSVLKAIVRLTPGFLEKAERLEQLRWIENGYTVYAGFTEFDSFAIDTPEDLSKFTNNTW